MISNQSTMKIAIKFITIVSGAVSDRITRITLNSTITHIENFSNVTVNALPASQNLYVWFRTNFIVLRHCCKDSAFVKWTIVAQTNWQNMFALKLSMVNSESIDCLLVQSCTVIDTIKINQQPNVHLESINISTLFSDHKLTIVSQRIASRCSLIKAKWAFSSS